MDFQLSKHYQPKPETAVEFGQEKVAEDVIQILKNDDQIRVAIEGPFGSGKSRVLHLIQDELENSRDDDSMVIFKYEPWAYSPDATTLRRTFLGNLHETLLKKDVIKGPLEEIERFFKSETRTEKLSDQEVDRLSEIKTTKFWTDTWLKLRLGGLLLSAWFLIVSLVFILLWSIGVSFHPLLKQVGYLLTPAVGLLPFIFQSSLKGLNVPVTQEVEEPAIKTIDQFRKLYRKLRAELGEDRRLIVLIDDVDRCDQEGMKEVLTGLSTYLAEPSSDDLAPVSFVAVIDSERLDNLLFQEFQRGSNDAVNNGAEKDITETNKRHNILGKFFHLIVPTPQPDFDDLKDIIMAMSKDLDWDLKERECLQIADRAVRWCNSNLRATRVALQEALLIKSYGERLKENYDILKTEPILDDPARLFMVALLRSNSTDSSLREYLSDSAYWYERKSPPDGLDVVILESFTEDNLDPKPLLMMGIPLKSAFHAGNLVREAEQFAKCEDDVYQDEYDLVPSEIRLGLVMEMVRLMDRGALDLESGELIQGIKRSLDFLQDSTGYLNSGDSSIFKTYIRELKKENIVSDLESKDVEKMLIISEAVGVESFNLMIEDSSPLYNMGGHSFRECVWGHIPKMPPSYIDHWILSENGRISNHNSAEQVAQWAQFFSEYDKLRDLDNFGKLCLTILNHWNYNQEPPPKYVYDERAQAAMRNEDLEDEAEQVLTRVKGSKDNHDFADKLADANWPFHPE